VCSVGLPSLSKKWIVNNTNSPEINYKRHYFSGLSELLKLIKNVDKNLGKINIPASIIQCNDDLTVDPASATRIFDGISSKEKTISWINSNKHIIMLTEDCDVIFKHVRDFLKRFGTISKDTGDSCADL